MVKLNIKPNTKDIKLPSGKVVKIPKLGLKHYQMFKRLDVKMNTAITDFLDTICPGLNAAESEYIMVHLLAFNGKIQEKQTFGDFVLDINNMYFVCETEFEYKGVKYEFNAPMITDMFSDGLDVLQKQYKGTGVDFEEMPAFVLEWANKITGTVAIDTPQGTVYGGINIIGNV